MFIVENFSESIQPPITYYLVFITSLMSQTLNIACAAAV